MVCKFGEMIFRADMSATLRDIAIPITYPLQR